MVKSSDARSGQKTAAVHGARKGIEKVISALVRHQRHKKPGMLRYLPWYVIFSNLRRPDGGFEVIGEQGAKGFRQVADAFFRYQPKMRGRIRRSEAVEILRRILAREVFTRRRSVDGDRAANMLLAMTERYVRRYCLVTRTYILPCVLPHAKGGATFRIGPVGFLPTEAFLEKYREVIDPSREPVERLWLDHDRRQDPRGQESSGRGEPDLLNANHEAAEQWVRDFREIFSSYPWVAQVEIGSCAPRMGEMLARRAVNTALDALRLVFGRDGAYNIRLGGGFRLETKTAHATLNKQGDLDITFSQTWESSGLPDDWFEFLGRSNVEPLITSLGSLIRRITAGGVLPPLYQRAVDSLTWYGEAVAEPQPHTRIVRCVIALERLLVTPGKIRTEHEEKLNSALKVKRRGVLLCLMVVPRTRVHWEQKFKSLYDVRDDILHGKLSPFDARALKGAATADYVTKWCLRAGMFWLAHVAQRNPRMDATELHELYESDLERFCQHPDGSMPS